MTKKLISGSLAFFLFATQGLGDARGLMVPNPERPALWSEMPGPLALSPGLGTVVQEFRGRDKLIIHIQDAHAVYEAQHSIDSILRELTEKRGVKLIGLEGAAKTLRPERFRFFDLPAADSAVIDALVRRGELTGAERFAVTQAPAGVRIAGLENPSLYRRGLETFQSVLLRWPEACPAYGAVSEKILRAGVRVYSQELAAFDREKQAFEDRQTSLIHYARRLSRAARKFLKIDLLAPSSQREFPHLVRLNKLLRLDSARKMNAEERLREEKEILARLGRSAEGAYYAQALAALETGRWNLEVRPRSFFESLYGVLAAQGFEWTRYPAFRRFAESLIHQDELDSAALFREIAALEEAIYARLIRNRDEKRLAGVARDWRLIGRFLRLEISRSDFERLQAGSLTPSAVEARLAAIAPSPASAGREALDRLFEEARAFYQTAEERDRALVENLLSQMNRHHVKEAVLVSGGFHSTGIQELLESKNLSYVVISPKIGAAGFGEKEQREAEALYRDVILNRATGLEAAFEKNHIVAALKAVGRSDYAAMNSADPDRPEKAVLTELARAIAPLAESLARRDSSLRSDPSRWSGAVNEQLKALSAHPLIGGRGARFAVAFGENGTGEFHIVPSARLAGKGLPASIRQRLSSFAPVGKPEAESVEASSLGQVTDLALQYDLLHPNPNAYTFRQGDLSYWTERVAQGLSLEDLEREFANRKAVRDTATLTSYRVSKPSGSMTPGDLSLWAEWLRDGIVTAGEMEAEFRDLAPGQEAVRAYVRQLRLRPGAIVEDELRVRSLSEEYQLSAPSLYAWTFTDYDIAWWADWGFTEAEIRAQFEARRTVRRIAEETQFRVTDPRGNVTSGALSYWADKLISGEMTEQDLRDAFSGAVSGSFYQQAAFASAPGLVNGLRAAQTPGQSENIFLLARSAPLYDYQRYLERTRNVWARLTSHRGKPYDRYAVEDPFQASADPSRPTAALEFPINAETAPEVFAALSRTQEELRRGLEEAGLAEKFGFSPAAQFHLTAHYVSPRAGLSEAVRDAFGDLRDQAVPAAAFELQDVSTFYENGAVIALALPASPEDLANMERIEDTLANRTGIGRAYRFMRHATLAFTRAPLSPDEYDLFLAVLERFRGRSFGSLNAGRIAYRGPSGERQEVTLAERSAAQAASLGESLQELLRGEYAEAYVHAEKAMEQALAADAVDAAVMVPAFSIFALAAIFAHAEKFIEPKYRSLVAEPKIAAHPADLAERLVERLEAAQGIVKKIQPDLKGLPMQESAMRAEVQAELEMMLMSLTEGLPEEGRMLEAIEKTLAPELAGPLFIRFLDTTDSHRPTRWMKMVPSEFGEDREAFNAAVAAMLAKNGSERKKLAAAFAAKAGTYDVENLLYYYRREWAKGDRASRDNARALLELLSLIVEKSKGSKLRDNLVTKLEKAGVAPGDTGVDARVVLKNGRGERTLRVYSPEQAAIQLLIRKISADDVESITAQSLGGTSDWKGAIRAALAAGAITQARRLYVRHRSEIAPADLQPLKQAIWDARFGKAAPEAVESETQADAQSRDAAAKTLAFFNRFLGRPEDARFDPATLVELQAKFSALKTNKEKLDFTAAVVELLFGGDPSLAGAEEESSPAADPDVFAVEGATILDLSIEFGADAGSPGLVIKNFAVKPGSTGPNAGRVMASFGSEMQLTGLSGGFQGRVFRRGIREEQIGAVDLLAGKSRTSLFVFAPAADGERRLELHMRPSNPVLSPDEGDRLLERVRANFPPTNDANRFVILGGQIFAGLPVSYYTQLIELLKSRGYKVVADFKPYLTREEMNAILGAGPTMIKPNLEEFTRYFNMEESYAKQKLKKGEFNLIGSLAVTMAKSEKIEILIVSMEEYGAMVAYRDESGDYRVIHVPAPEIEPVSSVAAGDSLIGATVQKLTEGATVPEAIEYGVAAGSVTTTKPGTDVARRSEVEALVARMRGTEGRYHQEIHPYAASLGTQRALIKMGINPGSPVLQRRRGLASVRRDLLNYFVSPDAQLASRAEVRLKKHLEQGKLQPLSDFEFLSDTASLREVSARRAESTAAFFRGEFAYRPDQGIYDETAAHQAMRERMLARIGLSSSEPDRRASVTLTLSTPEKPNYVSIQGLVPQQPDIKLLELFIREYMYRHNGIPPIIILRTDDGKKFILDGHHRVATAFRNGQGEVEAHVIHLRNFQPQDLPNGFDHPLWRIFTEGIQDEDSMYVMNDAMDLRVYLPDQTEGGFQRQTVRDILRPTAALVQPAADRGLGEQGRPTAASLGSVLVVDDEGGIRDILPQMLNYFRQGLRVAVAADGAEGLALFEAESFDLVITDVNMPKMSGDELARRINPEGRTRTVSILMMTGLVQKNQAALDALTQAGQITGFMDKPFTMAALFAQLRRIEAALSEGASLGAERAQISPELARRFAEQVRYVASYGSPGAGKGTLMEEILRQINQKAGRIGRYETLVMGDYFRGIDRIVRDRRRPGDERYEPFVRLIPAEELKRMARGNILADEYAIDIINAILEQPQYKNAHGIFFDGFPRTPGQLRALEEGRIRINGQPLKIDLNVVLEVDESFLFDRILKRAEADISRKMPRPDVPLRSDGHVDRNAFERVFDRRMTDYRTLTRQVLKTIERRPNTVRVQGTIREASDEESIVRVRENFINALQKFLGPRYLPGRSRRLESYEQSSFNRMKDTRLMEAGDIASAGDFLAVEILKELQLQQKKLPPDQDVIVHFATGNTPWIGYTRLAEILSSWGSWDAATRQLLEKSGVDLSFRPDMGRVVAFPLDALFPQKRTDYHAFANILNNMFNKLGIRPNKRFLFYGDATGPMETVMPDGDYEALLKSIDRDGLLIDEYLDYRRSGHKVNARLFEHHVEQLAYLHSLYEYSQALARKIKELGGAHIFISGVGPSYAGKGHIGFMEAGTPFDSGVLMGLIGYHMAADHMKEQYGMGNLYAPNGRPKYGFVTFGFDELLHRKDVKVITIATGIQKAESIRRGVEDPADPEYPMTRLQSERGALILDRTSASRLRHNTNPWDFEKLGTWPERLKVALLIRLAEETGKPIRDLTVGDFLGSAGYRDPQIAPLRMVNLARLLKTDSWEAIKARVLQQIRQNLVRPEEVSRRLGIPKRARAVIVNPHLDDEYLAMRDVIAQLTREGHDVSVYYTAMGYTAVHSSYALSALERVARFTDDEILKLSRESRPREYRAAERKYLAQLARVLESGQDLHRDPADYGVWGHMSEAEQTLRAKLLFIHIYRYSGKALTGREQWAALAEALREIDQAKPRFGAQDVQIMKDIKVMLRFTDAQTALMSLGVPYENIHYPFDASWYGPVRSGTAKKEDIDEIEEVLAHERPHLVIVNGENFTDFQAHSTTQISTLAALRDLGRAGQIREDLRVLFYRGVWDRTPTSALADQLSVKLTADELETMDRLFRQHYPDQAPPPVPDSGLPEPRHFSREVIDNAGITRREIAGLAGEEVLGEEIAGVLNFNYIADWFHPDVQKYVDALTSELERVRGPVARAASPAINGPVPYPDLSGNRSRKLNRLFSRGKIPAGLVLSEREGELTGFSPAAKSLGAAAASLGAKRFEEAVRLYDQRLYRWTSELREEFPDPEGAARIHRGFVKEGDDWSPKTFAAGGVLATLYLFREHDRLARGRAVFQPVVDEIKAVFPGREHQVGVHWAEPGEDHVATAVIQEDPELLDPAQQAVFQRVTPEEVAAVSGVLGEIAENYPPPVLGSVGYMIGYDGSMAEFLYDKNGLLMPFRNRVAEKAGTAAPGKVVSRGKFINLTVGRVLSLPPSATPEEKRQVAAIIRKHAQRLRTGWGSIPDEVTVDQIDYAWDRQWTLRTMEKIAAFPLRGRETPRDTLAREAQPYADYLSRARYAPGYDSSRRPDVFMLLGNPDLETFLEFARQWKEIRDREGKRIPLMIAGGRGRGAQGLAARIAAHYAGVLNDADRQFLAGGQVSESELILFVLRQEGVDLEDSLIRLEKESHHTGANFVNSLSSLKELLPGDPAEAQIQVVTAPLLNLRVHETGVRKVEGQGWKIATVPVYPVSLASLGDDELTEIIGYVAGFPASYLPAEAINRKSEVEKLIEWDWTPADLAEGGWTPEYLESLRQLFAVYLEASGQGLPRTVGKSVAADGKSLGEGVSARPLEGAWEDLRETFMKRVNALPPRTLIVVGGTTGSGKSFFVSRRIRSALKLNGRGLRWFPVDNYPLPPEAVPQRYGRPDYEQYESYDHALVIQELKALLGGGNVVIPASFFERRRGVPIRLRANDFIGIEGLRVLDPRFLSALPSGLPVVKVFIDAAWQVRFLRRLIRDTRERGYDAADVLAKWAQVMESEQATLDEDRKRADFIVRSEEPWEIRQLAADAEGMLRALAADPAVIRDAALSKILADVGDYVRKSASLGAEKTVTLTGTGGISLEQVLRENSWSPDFQSGTFTPEGRGPVQVSPGVDLKIKLPQPGTLRLKYAPAVSPDRVWEQKAAEEAEPLAGLAIKRGEFIQEGGRDVAYIHQVYPVKDGLQQIDISVGGREALRVSLKTLLDQMGIPRRAVADFWSGLTSAKKIERSGPPAANVVFRPSERVTLIVDLAERNKIFETLKRSIAAPGRLISLIRQALQDDSVTAENLSQKAFVEILPGEQYRTVRLTGKGPVTFVRVVRAANIPIPLLYAVFTPEQGTPVRIEGDDEFDQVVLQQPGVLKIAYPAHGSGFFFQFTKADSAADIPSLVGPAVRTDLVDSRKGSLFTLMEELIWDLLAQPDPEVRSVLEHTDFAERISALYTKILKSSPESGREGAAPPSASSLGDAPEESLRDAARRGLAAQGRDLEQVTATVALFSGRVVGRETHPEVLDYLLGIYAPLPEARRSRQPEGQFAVLATTPEHLSLESVRAQLKVNPRALIVVAVPGGRKAAREYRARLQAELPGRQKNLLVLAVPKTDRTGVVFNQILTGKRKALWNKARDLYPEFRLNHSELAQYTVFYGAEDALAGIAPSRAAKLVAPGAKELRGSRIPDSEFDLYSNSLAFLIARHGGIDRLTRQLPEANQGLIRLGGINEFGFDLTALADTIDSLVSKFQELTAISRAA